MNDELVVQVTTLRIWYEGTDPDHVLVLSLFLVPNRYLDILVFRRVSTVARSERWTNRFE